MQDNSLQQLYDKAKSVGIGLNYKNAFNEIQEISATTLKSLLDALNTPGSLSIQKNLFIEPVYVKTEDETITINVDINNDYQWEVILENGSVHAFGISRNHKLELTDKLSTGYHYLKVTSLVDNKSETSQLIIAPKRCYEPKPLTENKKLWGACVQLYTLRSENCWGIGDFGSLQSLIEKVAQHGGSYVGLNPLHSLFPANPESASPYAPSSRKWLNVIYIDVSSLDDFKNNPKAQNWFNQLDIQEKLSKAKALEFIDYTLVQDLKIQALKLAYEAFLERPEKCLIRSEFEQFKNEGGLSLYQQAAFDAIHEKLSENDKMQWGWPVWDKAYASFSNEAVQQFCIENSNLVDFYAWLQFLAFSQLEKCYQTSRSLKMPIGIYRDLAVGVGEGGAEIWGDKELYCLKASVGAPPDILGPQGQNWGLPPMHPDVIYQRAYRPFIELLKANMQSCGALRMDHVMGLLRLWWIPYGETADQGAYVHYNVDHFLSIIALESQRNQCMIIGEDLGTVPPEIVQKLKDTGVYSYKVVYFENYDNVFSNPQDYQRQAIATVTTHDLPTLRGYWEKYDFELGKQLGVYNNDLILQQLSEDRDFKKQGLLNALHLNNCFDDNFTSNAKDAAIGVTLNRAIHRFTAKTSSALIGLQPEDWLLMKNPVNIPGTSDQYANWRRKLSKSVEEIFSLEETQMLLEEVTSLRELK